MFNFNDLLRRAKEVAGEGPVNALVEKLEQEQKSDTKRWEWVSVEKADLTPSNSEKQTKSRKRRQRPTSASQRPSATNERPPQIAQPTPASVVQDVQLPQSSAVQQSQGAPQPTSTGIPMSGSASVIMESIKWEYRYAMLGLVLGLASIIGGVVLSLNGVAGSTSWTASLLALNSKVNDAAPGVVLFIIGLL